MINLHHQHQQSTRRSALTLIAVCITYLIVIVIMTWPLARHINTHITGDGGDGPIFIWNAWWFDHALRTDDSLLYTNYLLAPEGVSLLFHTHTLVHDACVAILQYIVGFITAFNLVFLSSMVAAGVGGFFLARALTKSSAAAFVAGLTFMISAPILVRAIGHFNLTAVWPLPWFMYFFIRTLQEKKIYTAILAGAIGGLALLNDFYYPIFILLIGCLTLVAYGIWMRKEAYTKRTVMVLGIIGATTLLVAAPLLFPLLQAYRNGNAPPKPPLVDYETYAVDLTRYITPSYLHPILGEWATRTVDASRSNNGGIEHTVFAGYTVLFLSLLSLGLLGWRFKRPLFSHPLWWMSVALLGIVLSLGPVLRINGIEYGIWMPYRWLWELPIIGSLRVPSRFAVMAMLGFSMLVGLAISDIKQLIARARASMVISSSIIVLLIGAIGFEFFSAPFPLYNLRVPSIYTQPAVKKTDGTLLTLPFGMKSGFQALGQFPILYQYAQILHERPLIGGYLSRISSERFDELANLPGLGYLITFPARPQSSESFVPQRIQQEFIKYNITQIIIHTETSYYNAITLTALQNYLKYVIQATLIEHNETYELYSVPRIANNDTTNRQKDILPPLTTLSTGETVENGLLPQRFTHAIATAAGTDVAFIHTNTFRDGIPQGIISTTDIARAYPWSDSITTATISCGVFSSILHDPLYYQYPENYNCTDNESVRIAIPNYLTTTPLADVLSTVQTLPITVLESAITDYQTLSP